MMNLKDRMIDKSIEAFMMSLEIYNKPTITYRIEGFSFFVINAWELMLKAELIKRGESIYYKDKQDRTLSINDVLKRIYTDKNTRIRLNLEKIIELRNISTHFITEDYEVKYVPLFQACVLNYVNEIKKFHGIDITDHIAQNFLMISARYEPLSNEQIRMKYPSEIAEKLIRQANEIEVLSNTYNSDKFSIEVKQNLYLTKKKSEADFLVSLAPDSDNKIARVKELKDPVNTHKYSFQNVIVAVNEKLKKNNIRLDYDKGFNSYVLSLIIDFYDVKLNKDYAYEHIIGNQHNYTYSQQFIDFIVDEIRKNPTGFVASLKRHKKR